MLINFQFGYKRLVQTQEVVGSRIRMGGYSITYDMAGNEISRTPNTWNCELECWSESEAKRLADRVLERP